ncbi:MAG: membrane or secreted protein [Flavobacteriaceae bacterium]|nr:membrane or secreted protein [Flavobacteriaceae bacterium]
MELFLLSLVLVGVSFAGIAIKIWTSKDGRFNGTCASQSPFLNKNGQSCQFCGKTPEQNECQKPKLN